jgi:hypothetical protein
LVSSLEFFKHRLLRKIFIFFDLSAGAGKRGERKKMVWSERKCSVCSGLFVFLFSFAAIIYGIVWFAAYPTMKMRGRIVSSSLAKCGKSGLKVETVMTGFERNPSEKCTLSGDCNSSSQPPTVKQTNVSAEVFTKWDDKDLKGCSDSDGGFVATLILIFIFGLLGMGVGLAFAAPT